MAAIPDSVRQVVEAGRLASLVTLNRDGGPQVTIVWVGLDGDEIVSGHLGIHQKVRNVRRDARVALSIATDKTNASGLTEYLVVYGHARITEGGAPELLQRLAHTYIGPGVKFPPMDNPPPGYITRITPDRFAGVGPWALMQHWAYGFVRSFEVFHIVADLPHGKYRNGRTKEILHWQPRDSLDIHWRRHAPAIAE